MNTVRIVSDCNINGLHHQVAKMEGLENLSLWQKLSSFKTKSKTRDSRYMMLDTRYRVLDTRYMIPDTGYWILDTGYWILDIGYWILDT